jgi:AbrB family looped-hinge helix DNA binding protein
MPVVTVSSTFQVVIPREVRERLPLSPGNKVEVMLLDGRIELVPVKPARHLKGFLARLENNFERGGASDRAPRGSGVPPEAPGS